MKKGFIIVLYSILIILNCPSQTGWEELNSGVSVQLNSVTFSNDSPVWCCGNNGTILKSTNIGNNWQNVSSNIPNTATLVNIASHNDTIAMVTGYIGNTSYVWRTINGGANWNQVFSQVNGFVNSIWIWYNYTLIQGNPVGGRWSLWKSTNFGQTWDSTGLYLNQTTSEHGWPNSLFSWNPNSIWFGTSNSRIYYSFNSANSWQVQSTAPEQNSRAVYVQGSGGLALTGGLTLMKSTNSGTNWVQISSMGSGNICGAFVHYPNCWYARNENKIYLSTNSGLNWIVHYTAPSGNYRHLFGGSIPWAIGIYGVRDNGGISRYVASVGIKQISTEIPESFSLSQNYPNPFNPATTIKFEIPKTKSLKAGETYSKTEIRIYDILGREVEVLDNEQLSPGTYEVEWNGTNYPSGIYYYSLSAGDFIETKKMALIK